MKKVLALGMLGLLLAFAVALGTSATFRDYSVKRSVHISVVADDDELIDLTPVQPYAYINKTTGKLMIDISKNNPNWPGHKNATWAEMQYGIGISPDSRYNFDHVFNVSNHLWENKNITVEVISSTANILFYNKDGKIYVVGSGEQPTNSDEAHTMNALDVCFVLEPGESVGLGIDFYGGAGLGSQDSTITVKAWPEGDEPFTCGGGPQ